MDALEVFADVCCPFTHVGLRRIVRRRAELGRDDVVLVVRAWPLELVNGVPLDPESCLFRDVNRAKFLLQDAAA